MVACRKPKTRSAAEGSSPSASRDEHHGDMMRRGLQTVQGSVASSTEGGVTSRASKGLDLLSMTVLAIANQRMNGSVCNPEVLTLVVGTAEAFGGYPLGWSPPALHLAPGA